MSACNVFHNNAVNGSALHGRCEVVGVAKHPVGKPLVPFVIPRHHDELGAQFARPRRGHGRINPKLPGFVGGRGDDAPAFTAHGDGLAPNRASADCSTLAKKASASR